MRKTFKLFLSLFIMTVMFLGINSNVNASEIPNQVSVTGFQWLGTPSTGRYGIFAVEPSGGTHAYCLDVEKQAPMSGNFVRFDASSVYSYAQLNRMIAVLRTSGDPQFKLGLSETDSFYVTQAALWYAEYGRTGNDLEPLTSNFHSFLKGSSIYGAAYNKLLAAIDEANSGKDFTKVNNTISVNDKNGKLGQSMHEVVVDGKKYLLSDSLFVVSAPGKYTVSVKGGYLADSNGKNTGKITATYNTNDSFRIIIPVAEGTNKTVSATFYATTVDSYVSGYSLQGYQSLTSSGLQRLALLFTDEQPLSVNYTVKQYYDDTLKSTDIKIAKVNKEGKLISGAKLGIYSNDSLVGSYNSTDKYITVSLKPGEYSLKEISAPSGYLLNDQEIKFTVDKDGNVKDSNNNVVANKTFTVVDELPTIKIRKINEKKVDIKGAEIVICDYDTNTKKESNCNFKWITDGTTKELTIGVDFGKIADGSYIIKEVSAPHGYEISAPKVITVKDGKLNGDIQKNTVTIVDSAYLEVSKTDATGQKEVPGAEMKLFDKNGELKEEWTSSEKAHKISGLVPGEVYEIVEKTAPQGYVALTTSIKFRITDEGKVETLDCGSTVGSGVDASSCKVMSAEEILKIKNDVTKLKISKVDVTNQEEMEGAKLQILNADGSPVYQDGKILEWISGTEKDENGKPLPHYIEMLPVGDYKLIETFSPKGYAAVSNEVYFSVKPETGIQTVVFENAPIKGDEPTKVVISKKDFTNGQEIEGAHLAILNVDGTPVYQNGEKLEWISGTTPHEIEMLPAGKYILVETLPADGYKNDMIVDGMITSKYEFEVKENGVLRIDVYNEVIEAPNTGMNVSSTYVIGSMVVLAGIGTITVGRRKNEI